MVTVREYINRSKGFKWLMYIGILTALMWHGVAGCSSMGVHNSLNNVPIGRPMGSALANLENLRLKTGNKVENSVHSICKIGLKGGCPRFAKGFRLIFGFSVRLAGTKLPVSDKSQVLEELLT